MEAQEGHRRRDPESHKSRSTRLHNGHKEHKEHKEPREGREHRRHGHNHTHNGRSERSDADGFRGGASRNGYGAEIGGEKERPDRGERHSARHDRTSGAEHRSNGDRHHHREEQRSSAAYGVAERHGERHREERQREERDDRGDYSRPPLHIVQRSGGGGGGGGGNGAAGGQVKIFGASTHRSKAPAEGGTQGGPAAEAARKKPQFSVPEPPPPFVRCRFMDDEWHICHEAVNRGLLEQSSEFTVVACVGAQGVGKSTALSLLFSSFLDPTVKGEHGAARGGGSRAPSTRGGAGATSEQPEEGFEAPLPSHPFRSYLEGGKALLEPGVELCVSRLDRLLLLDVQPLFCCDAHPDAELQSEIYLLLFLASICHTMLLVTDTPMDLQLCKLLRLMATLKSKVPDLATWIEQHSGEEAGGERRGAAEQYLQQEVVLPKLVVAFNHVAPEMEEEELCDPIRDFLQQSPWKAAPSVRFARIPTLPGASPSSMITSDAARRAGMGLRQRLLPGSSERGRFGRHHALQLTECDWLHHVAGYWDFVQGAGVVQDYFDTGSRAGAACGSRKPPS